MKPRRILVISPVPTHPPNAGNRARVGALLNALQALGHEVYFLHVKREWGDDEMMRAVWGDHYLSTHYVLRKSVAHRFKRRLQTLVNSEARYLYSLDEWYDTAVDDTLQSLRRRLEFDTVIVEYVFFSRALRGFGRNVLKIIDTHDVFTDRHRVYLREGQEPRWYSMKAKEEGRGLDRADVVIAIQEKERDFFSKITRSKVITVGHLVTLHRAPQHTARAGRMLFVASDNAINVEGIKYFIAEILPRIRESVAGAEVALVGRICRAIEDQSGVLKLGELDDLKPEYEAASLVINPVRFNTGVSIKNVEALGFARPLVSETVGADGLEDGVGSAFLISGTPDDFADKAIKVLTDHDFSHRLAGQAYEYASEWNRRIMRQLEEVLANGQARAPTNIALQKQCRIGKQP